MLRPSEYHDLLSGRRRGLAASVVRAMLRVAEVPYTAAVRWRNQRYDTVADAVRRLNVPVVSVGNLTLGGTGKTPLVRWIAEWLHHRGVRPAIVSRGYGRQLDRPNDEATELNYWLPNTPHLQNPDRVTAAQKAVERFAAEVIVLDDAFQHRRIGRDLDIVLLDATEPFGHGHVFPRGTLREPLEGLCRADVVVLSRSDAVQPIERESIRREVQRLVPEAAWVEVAHAPRAFLAPDGQQQPIPSLSGQPVAAFCGIGNPDGFRHTLSACGCRVVAFREFPDHHRYTSVDAQSLADWADERDVAAVICTHKDLVKLGSLVKTQAGQFGSRPLLALTIGIEFLTSPDPLKTRLSSLL